MSNLDQRRAIHAAHLGAVQAYDLLDFGALDHDAGSLVQTWRACRLASSVLELERLSALYRASETYQAWARPAHEYRGQFAKNMSGFLHGAELCHELKTFCDGAYDLLRRQRC